MKPDFSTITELPGSPVLPVQVHRSFSRYTFASLFCEGKDVLEVACGGGQGLGLLAERARRVVGGDCEKNNLVYARNTYNGTKNIEVIELDAQAMPFGENSFDLILLYEAIYYLKEPEKFIRDCRRILRPDGRLLLCTANKIGPYFNPSPFSHNYYSIPEMKTTLESAGFSATFYGAFPDDQHSLKNKLRSAIKRTAVRLHLMPRTMSGKIWLKRFFFGGLTTMPRAFSSGMMPYTPPVHLPGDKVDTVHTALFALATPSGPHEVVDKRPESS